MGINKEMKYWTKHVSEFLFAEEGVPKWIQPSIQNGEKTYTFNNHCIYTDLVTADKIADSTEKMENTKSETNTSAVSVVAASDSTSFETLKLNLSDFALQYFHL